MRYFLIALLYLLAFTALSCGSESADSLSTGAQKRAAANDEKPVSVPGAFPTAGQAPKQVSFSDAGSYDPDGGAIVQWEWNFGEPHNGQGGWHDFTSTQGSAAHTYVSPGTYNAHLRVTDDEGSKDTARIELTITADGNVAPVAMASAAPLSGAAPLEVDFSAAGSSDSDGFVVMWEWDFGDSVFLDFTSTMGETSFTYTAAGTYTAVLRVTDDNGATAVDSVEITVSDPPPAEWAHTLGGAGLDWFVGVDVDAAGNVYALGNTNSFGAGDWDAYLASYAPDGSLRWQRTYGSAAFDKPYDCCTDAVGNTYITGLTLQPSNEAFIAKFDSAGNLVWQTLFGDFNIDSTHGIDFDSAGNLICCGYTYNATVGESDVLLLKLSTAGALLDKRTWGGSGLDVGWDILGTSDGSVYFNGETRSFGVGIGQAQLTVKLDPAGNIVWQKVWDLPGTQTLGNLGVDSTGNVYVAGNSFPPVGFESDAFVISYDPAGALRWQRIFGGPGGWDQFNGIAVRNDGHVFCTGYAESFGTPKLTVFDFLGDGTLLAQHGWEHPGGAYGDGKAVLDSSGALFAVGDAPDAAGFWTTFSGGMSVPAGNEITPTAVLLPAVGSLGAMPGIVTTPPGVYDTGGGGYDTLVVKREF